MRAQIGSSEEPSKAVSDMEVALIAVMAAFLTVHPLGASMSEISTYFQTFNPTYNSYYLESLLRRMPKVFQLSQAANGEPRWWFLGFQTVSITVQSQAGTSNASPAQATSSSPATKAKKDKE